MIRKQLLPALAVLALCAACEQGRTADPAGAAPTDTDLANLGHPDSVLVWNAEERIAGFRNFDRLRPTNPIHAGSMPYPLPERPTDLSHIRYDVDGESWAFDDFTRENHVAGLLVLHEGEILHEEYGLGNTRDTRWVSFSIAKSVSSLLMGAAVQDGLIESLDAEITEYMPVFEGTSYEGVSVRDVLQMASGVAWNEDYADRESDISHSIGLTLEETFEYMGNLPRVAEPGEEFNYNTAETHVVGGVIRAATGRGLADYLTEKIWRPFGMESDATWVLVEEGGPEYAGCCINATLRDYGRIGLFVMADGVLPDGTRVLPESWMEESTAPSEGSAGYGYLWWRAGLGAFGAYGIFGQTIYIDPDVDLIVVTHSAWPEATGDPWGSQRAAFFNALSGTLRRAGTLDPPS